MVIVMTHPTLKNVTMIMVTVATTLMLTGTTTAM